MSGRIGIQDWVGSYDRRWLRADVVGGLTVAAVLIPSALAYSSIVGVDPIVGLYTVPPALIAYAIFGGSRLLVVGPDAAISVLAASTVAVVAADGVRTLDAVLALTLATGAIYLVMRLLRMGWIADLVPQPVVRGFIQGLALVTILDQVPALLGLVIDHDDRGFVRQLVQVVGALDTADGATAALGLGALTMLFGCRAILPRVPAPLLVLVGSMLLLGTTSLSERVSVVGEPTGPLLDLGLPSGIETGHVVDLLPGALAIVVLGFTQTMGAATTAAGRTGERLDPDRELLALGAANVASGLGGGFVVGGTLSKTSVAMSAGGHTQLGNLVAAAVGIVSLVVLRPLFDELASAVLAAIVVYAMSGLVDLTYFRTLWSVSRREFAVAMLAFVGVLAAGVLVGVVVAVVAAFLLVAIHVGRPPTYRLVRTDDGWHPPASDDETSALSGLVAWRQDGPLLFMSARRYCSGMVELADRGAEVIALDASATSAIDSTGLSMLLDTVADLEVRGVVVWVVGPIDRPLGRADRIAATLDRALPDVLPTLDEASARFENRAHDPSPGRVTPSDSEEEVT